MATSTTLVADVGGTNTRIAMAQGASVDESSIQSFRNKDFDSLYDVLAAFGPSTANAVCVDLAGPVGGGVGKLTNLSWVVSEDDLRAKLNVEKALLINDMQAQGYALDQLQPNEVRTVLPGPGATDSTRLVVNVGTGFNSSPVFHINGRPFVPENEAGHIALATPHGISPAVLNSFAAEDDFLSVEDILSGRGLARVVAKLAPSYTGEPVDIFPTFQTNPTPELESALRVFATVMGSVTGDLALAHLPRGGIYLVGGVAVGASPFLRDLGFSEAFHAKGRFRDFMYEFSVHANLDPMAALTGCAVAMQAQV